MKTIEYTDERGHLFYMDFDETVTNEQAVIAKLGNAGYAVLAVIDFAVYESNEEWLNAVNGR